METEPRGDKCGGSDDDMHGPDLSLPHAGHTHFIGFKPANVIAPARRVQGLEFAKLNHDPEIWSTAME